jgi:hypothetical protein
MWNLNSRASCDPADYHKEGSGFCSGFMNGWDRGGMSTMSYSTGQETCWRGDRGDCPCEDCASGGTKCLDYRCPDDVGELRYSPTNGGEILCFLAGTDTLLPEKTYDYCFEKSNPSCDPSVCSKGQYVEGCFRTTPGRCADCGATGHVLAPGMYWGAPGHGPQSCTTLPCTLPLPGQFIKTPCSPVLDADVRSCAEYPGNRKSVHDLSPEQHAQLQAGKPGVFDVDRFYCPLGNLVLPLPANALASQDYTAFVCRDGYYAQEQACLPCPPGAACRFGRLMPCPVNYYSRATASSHCTLCTTSCRDGRRPLRCAANSTFDGGCVSCGFCTFSVDTGLACVENDYEMRSLSKSCLPPQSGDWDCRKTP